MKRLVQSGLAALTMFIPVAAAAATCGPLTESAPIAAVRVTGSTLDAGVLSQAYASVIGRSDTTAARQDIAKAIAAAYSHSDIALYDVSPGPQGGCGVVDISVLEGHVGTATVQGRLDGPTARLVNLYLGYITAQRPLRISTLQRYVTLIRDLAGVRSQVRFEPTEQRDIVQMVVSVTRRRIKAGVSIDNRGAAVIGTIQAQLSASMFGLLSGGDQLDTTFIATQYPKRMMGASASYSVPVGAKGTRVSVSVSRSRNQLPEYDYRADSTVLAASIDRPIIKNYAGSAYVGLNLRRTVSHVSLFGYDLLTNRGWSVGPSASLIRSSDNSEFAASLSSAFGSVRRSSSLIYVAPTRKMRRLTAQAISHRWLGRGLTLRMKGVAQIGTRNLPPTDQLGLGGSEFGRAFASGFIAGDSGYAASVELALRLGNAGENKTANEAYVFLDGGRLSYHDPLSSFTDQEMLASSGIGIRIASELQTALSIEAAAGTARVFGEDRTYRRLSIGLQRSFL